MPRFYDVSLPVTEKLITYPGDPEIEIRPAFRIAEGDAANVTSVTFGTHVGTHVDAPRHFFDGAPTVDEIPLDRLIGPAVVVEIPDAVTEIGERELRSAGVEGERRVLLKTRNGRLLGREGFQRDYAHLTGDAAEFLVTSGAWLVGVDYLSVEAFHAEQPVVHETLLGRHVIIVEGLDLREVPPGRYELLCLPVRLEGSDGAPARVVLRSL